MDFGSRLRALRKAAGLSQVELGKGLAEHGDAGKQVVLGWEKGRHFPKVDQLAKICGKLNCSADYLLFGSKQTWPFTIIPIERFMELDPVKRGIVEGRLIEIINDVAEQQPSKVPPQVLLNASPLPSVSKKVA